MCPGAVATAASKDNTKMASDDNKMDIATATPVTPSTTPTSALNLETCTPDALAQHLLEHRFFNDQAKTVAFLQATLKAVPKVVAANTTDTASIPTMDLGKAILSEPLETSLIVPRAGKFHIQFFETGMLCTKLNDKSVTLFLPTTNISHAIVFAKPEDIKTICNVTKSKKPKPPNAHLVYLQLSKSVPFQGTKEINKVCFALSWNKAEGPTGPKLANDNSNDNDDSMSGWKAATWAWQGVLQSAFPNAIHCQVHPEDDVSRQPFRSATEAGQSTTTGNMPFVKCYHGVQDGVLYPLEEGLLFFKPPKFIPRSDLHSIACGRGGGPNASRYVDMHLELNNNNNGLVEFTNIQREEIGVLNKYIQQVLIPAMKQDVAKQGDDDKQEKDGEGDNEDTEEEEENDENTEPDSDDEDDSEDENFVGGSGSEQEEGDDDDDDSEDEDEDGDDECEVVQDDFAQELVKRKKEDSATESDESDESPSRPKRRRR